MFLILLTNLEITKILQQLNTHNFSHILKHKHSILKLNPTKVTSISSVLCSLGLLIESSDGRITHVLLNIHNQHFFSKWSIRVIFQYCVPKLNIGSNSVVHIIVASMPLNRVWNHPTIKVCNCSIHDEPGLGKKSRNHIYHRNLL